MPNGSSIDIILYPLGVSIWMNDGQLFECLLGLPGEYLSESFKIMPLARWMVQSIWITSFYFDRHQRICLFGTRSFAIRKVRCRHGNQCISFSLRCGQELHPECEMLLESCRKTARDLQNWCSRVCQIRFATFNINTFSKSRIPGDTPFLYRSFRESCWVDWELSNKEKSQYLLGQLC